MKDSLSETFSALADPTRRAILHRLTKGELNVNDVAEPFLKEMSLPAITKHLKVLEKAGLVERSREAQWRPCKLKGEALMRASHWIEQYRQYWEESLDRLDEYIKSIHPEAPKKGKKSHGKKKAHK